MNNGMSLVSTDRSLQAVQAFIVLGSEIVFPAFACSRDTVTELDPLWATGEIVAHPAVTDRARPSSTWLGGVDEGD